MLAETAPKAGHRVIYTPFLDERGRTFHKRQEDNEGIPGAYYAFEPYPGAWVAIGMGGRDYPEGPTWKGGRLPKFFGVEHLGVMYVLFPDGWRWDEAQARALIARHAGDACCDRCGNALELRTAMLDARTVDERAICSTCTIKVSGECYEAVLVYREMQCACGAWCYAQDGVTERGPWHDVQRCGKCKALKCAECLPDGQAKCQGCTTKAKRRAA